jgi:hypothetical protein
LAKKPLDKLILAMNQEGTGAEHPPVSIVMLQYTT